MPELNFGQTFGFDKLNITNSTISNIALVILISIVILALFGFLIYMVTMKKIYVYRLRVFKTIGNTPTQIGYFKGKAVSIGKVGDFLMFVKGAKKWLEFPTLQTAKNEYWFYIREDGEWINFVLKDLNEVSKLMGVKFIKQDMRLARLSIDEILAQRLLHKSFLERWGIAIGFAIFFLIIAVSLVIFMYQYGKTAGQFTESAKLLKEAIQIAYQHGGGSNSTQLIPASAFMVFYRRKKKWQI